MPFDNTFETDGPQPVISISGNNSPEGVQNLVGNALEWTSAYYFEDYHYGSAPYDINNYWDGQDETYDGTQSFIRLGGGWQRRIYHLAEIAQFPGENTDANTGIRCASD
jgi:formylglycine-generating enzyme required for sulfatase activity